MTASPAKPENRPGLSQLAYRIGDYASVRQRLLSQLANLTLEGIRPLESLTTRSPDDPAIALLDAWAVVADVLTFYQERIINEGYLMTATERRSVLELARAIGYELSPGVAASTFLAFTVEDAAGSAGVATVPQGTQVLSLPIRQDELPQTFETSEPLLARADWNALLPRPTRPQTILPSSRSLFLSGTATQLQIGDAVLLRDETDPDRFYLLDLVAVQPVSDRSYTRIEWQNWLPEPPPQPLRKPQMFALRQKAQLFDQSIRGGLFRLSSDSTIWTPQNTGLPNAEVTCLATVGRTVFVGTGNGVFRSGNGGDSWEAVNNGLTILSVQSLYAAGTQLFAGTLSGGLFRSSDEGETWVPIHLGGVALKDLGDGKFQSLVTSLPNSVIRSTIAYISTLGSGTVTSDETGRVSGDQTQFTVQLKVGDQITALGRSRRVTQILDDNTLQVDQPFETPDLRPGTNFTAVTTNAAGAIVLTNGTISSVGTTVIGIDTEFLRLEDGTTVRQLFALGQTKTIVRIDANDRLVIDSPFVRRGLDPGSQFFIGTPALSHYLAGTDDGVYRSIDRGKNWSATNLSDQVIYALAGDASRLWAGTSLGVYTSQDQGVTWTSSGLADRTVRSLLQSPGVLLAGTDAGLYVSTDQGANWPTEASLGGKIYALASQAGQLLAATHSGVYQSSNQGVTWSPLNGNTGLTTPWIVGIAVTETALFAGGRSTNVSAADWEGFTPPTQEVDLDGQYPKILPGSWAVLRNQAQVELLNVETIALVARAQATQEIKVTRLKPEQPIADPQRFSRRQTIVLAQSEPIALAEEVLTVTAQQSAIFADPLSEKTIFLQEFVQGLQPEQLLIVSGKRIQVQIRQAGGIYRSASQPIVWSRFNPGLENFQVQALTRHQGVLYAGTRQGIFQFTAGGLNWEPIQQELSNRRVQAFSPPDSPVLLAGTADGLFRRTETAWELVSQSLLYQNIRAIAVLLPEDSLTTTPSIAPSPTGAIVRTSATLFIGTHSGGVFRSQNNGTTWTTTALSNVDVLALAVDPQTQILLAGTDGDGLFFSTDRGDRWRQITDRRSGQGTIATQGIQVSRSGQFDDLKPGDIIHVGDQSRTILSTTPTIVIDAPFRPDLSPGTPFTVSTGLTSKLITALAIVSVQDARTQEFTTTIFAGTAGSGVFRSSFKGKMEPSVKGNIEPKEYRSTEAGDRWTAINANLVDLEIRCLAIDAAGRLLAGTGSGGLFRSSNQGELWAPVNAGLRNLDVRAILVNSDDTNSDNTNSDNTNSDNTNSDDLLLGGIGILIDRTSLTTVELQPGDRLQLMTPPVPIQSAEDDTLYHRWLLQDRDGFSGTLETIAVLGSKPSPELKLLPADPKSELVSELVQVDLPPDDQEHPVLTLKAALTDAYDPETVTIAANVVRATQGETVTEILGSGDGLAANQRFVLKKPPLTYVSAATASGAASTLALRVNGILWQEVRSLYGLSGQAECYTIRIEDDGATHVNFGDGSNGARLPTGQENVTGVYRSGIGRDGNMGANRLSLLKTQPLGIRGVNNPLPASGAADRERLETARIKAPRTVRTLDRIVSLRDFEDFTRTFAGIGKAQAVALWTGNAQIVHLTIAAVGGDAVLPESSLYQNLLDAIDAARDPVQRVQVDSYQPLRFNLEARLLIDPRYDAKTVIAQVEAALQQAFAFEQRGFGQSVTSAEAIAIVQSIAGIIAVDLDALYRLGGSRSLQPELVTQRAGWNETTGQIDPAQLLLINSGGIRLTSVSTL
ncbi:putative baseplate assembly protein [Leptolyngbya ohadii]|uniref:putative baseplate assembly protein n=1 Tax=Leptolyngbya ohadii TaxID=1962290 RepID=UPI000B59AA97|nr:putative baseplate assembly protein [Leptolyngbya ohadii]